MWGWKRCTLTNLKKWREFGETTGVGKWKRKAKWDGAIIGKPHITWKVSAQTTGWTINLICTRHIPRSILKTEDWRPEEISVVVYLSGDRVWSLSSANLIAYFFNVYFSEKQNETQDLYNSLFSVRHTIPKLNSTQRNRNMWYITYRRDHPPNERYVGNNKILR